MKIYEMSELMSFTTIIPFFLSTILSVLIWIQSILQNRIKVTRLLCGLNAVSCYFLFTFEKEVIRAVHSGRKIERYARGFAKLPFGLLQLVAIVTAMFTAYLLYSIIRWQKLHVSKRSIKYGMDILPLGLCYYYDNGVIRLVNQRMNEIAQILTGRVLTNANALWQAIEDGKFKTENVLLERKEDPVVRLADGRVFTFKRKSIQLEKKTLWELSATELTEEYEKRQILEDEQKRVEEINQRLKEFSKRVTQVTIEKEILTAKLRIHDELGHALIATRRYLATDGNDHEALLSHWQNNIALLKNERPETILDDYEAILQIAESCGIQIHVNGQLPQDTGSKNILSSAMSECVTNTYKHAHGDEIMIKIVDGQDYIHITIVNTGEPPKQEIRETGGLANLRNMVEAAGGVMQIESIPHFMFSLSIIKN